jgi:hypothetical protein
MIQAKFPFDRDGGRVEFVTEMEKEKQVRENSPLDRRHDALFKDAINRIIQMFEVIKDGKHGLSKWTSQCRDDF